MQTGHIDLRQADEEVSLANEQRLKDGMSRPRQLWALAAQKMGINTEEAQKAGRGMANVAVKAATLDLKAIRRKGSGASWASIIEEKRRQDKIAEAELEENAKVCGVVVAVFVCACVCACVCVCVCRPDLCLASRLPLSDSSANTLTRVMASRWSSSRTS
jgi:ribosomal protein L13E